MGEGRRGKGGHLGLWWGRTGLRLGLRGGGHCWMGV